MNKGCLIIILSLFLVACEHKATTFVILETTDMHGEFLSPMASLTSYIRATQEKFEDNLLLLDCGDNLQGSSTVHYYNYINNSDTHITTELLRFLPYTALTVGNHDIEAGKLVYDRVYRGLRAPVLGANIIHSFSKRPYFKPYTIVYRDGYKIAILGLVSSQALQWIPEDNRDGLEYQSIEEAAIYWVERIHKKENPDILIALSHCGLQEESGVVDKGNAMGWVADNVSGIDIICCGHDHASLTTTRTNKYGETIYVLESGTRAQSIAQATVVVSPVPGHKPNLNIATKLIDSSTLPPDRAYLEKFTPMVEKANAFENTPICYLDSTIYSRDAYDGPCPWVDQLHWVYAEISKKYNRTADITFANSYHNDAVLAQGELYAKDFVFLCPYENTLSIVEMTGNEIKEYLEYTYSLRIDYPNEPIYNWDTAGGIRYTVDASKPKGERIDILSMSNGNRFYGTKRYYVAMSTYRALGGGTHLNKELGWSKRKMVSRRVWASQESLREEIMNIYSEQQHVMPTALTTWQYL